MSGSSPGRTVGRCIPLVRTRHPAIAEGIQADAKQIYPRRGSCQGFGHHSVLILFESAPSSDSACLPMWPPTSFVCPRRTCGLRSFQSLETPSFEVVADRMTWVGIGKKPRQQEFLFLQSTLEIPTVSQNLDFTPRFWSSNSGAVSFNIQVGDNPRWRGSFYCQKHEVMLTTPESAPLDFHTLFEHHNAISGHD